MVRIVRVVGVWHVMRAHHMRVEGRAIVRVVLVGSWGRVGRVVRGVGRRVGVVVWRAWHVMRGVGGRGREAAKLCPTPHETETV